jgi:hypothetical protein
VTVEADGGGEEGREKEGHAIDKERGRRLAGSWRDDKNGVGGAHAGSFAEGGGGFSR